MKILMSTYYVHVYENISINSMPSIANVTRAYASYVSSLRSQGLGIVFYHLNFCITHLYECIANTLTHTNHTIHV